MTTDCSADLDPIARTLAGDIDAFRVLVERYEISVLRLVRNLAPRSVSVDDIAQDAFLTAFELLPRFDGRRGAFSAWLLTIARNKCLDAQKKRREVLLAHDDVVIENFPLSEDPIGEREILARLDSVLDAMPIEQRTAFVLSHIVGVPHDEIAQIEGVDQVTVRTRIHRARFRLQAVLQPDLEKTT